MNLLTGMYVKMTNQFDSWMKNEKGSQTLEWLGIAAVIVIIVGIISNAFDDSLGTTVKNKFTSFIRKIGG